MLVVFHTPFHKVIKKFNDRSIFLQFIVFNFCSSLFQNALNSNLQITHPFSAMNHITWLYVITIVMTVIGSIRMSGRIIGVEMKHSFCGIFRRRKIHMHDSQLAQVSNPLFIFNTSFSTTLTNTEYSLYKWILIMSF